MLQTLNPQTSTLNPDPLALTPFGFYVLGRTSPCGWDPKSQTRCILPCGALKPKAQSS